MAERIRYTTRPLSDRAWLRSAAQRRGSQFKVSWSAALDLLGRELAMIDGRELVLEVDVREQDLRLDGTLRANARAVGAPAVVVAFESKHGPLLYRSDAYGAGSWASPMEVWQHNVYAVALTLEALRAVDRYGAARSGEQYRGYRQIGGGPSPAWTDARAWMTLIRAAYPQADETWWERAAEAYAAGVPMPGLDCPTQLLRRAQRLTHPDTAHPEAIETFDVVQLAAAHLRVGR